MLGFTLLVSCVAGLLFGLAPAVKLGRVDVNETLNRSDGIAAVVDVLRAVCYVLREVLAASTSHLARRTSHVCLYLTNTFGMIASGSPRRKIRIGALSACMARRSVSPISVASDVAPSIDPNGLASDSTSDRFGG